MRVKGTPATYSEKVLTESYEERKQRLQRERNLTTSKVAAALGRPMAIPPGSDKERRFKAMWNDGTQIKLIAADLGVSIRAIRDTRARLKLKTRRPDLGKGTQLRIALDAATMKLLRAGAARKGRTKAAYIRLLIQLDAGTTA